MYMYLCIHTHPCIMYTVHVTILFLPSLNSDHFYYVALKNTSHKLLTSFHNPLIYHGLQLEKHSGRDCAASQIFFQREDSTVEPGVSKPGLGERDLEKKKKEGSVPAAGVFHSG